jgi:hypothetical protein
LRELKKTSKNLSQETVVTKHFPEGTEENLEKSQSGNRRDQAFS